LPGHVVGFDRHGRPFLCRGGDLTPPCDHVAAWQADVDELAHDIFDGHGHAGAWPGTPPPDLLAKVR
jgi:hypothetical protein